MSPDTPAAETPVRVLIVDDTRTIRAMIRALLARSPLIQVVGEARDPYEARDLIRTLKPDVLTLDVIMPRMDGLSFLERLMRLHPMPVVMVSTRTSDKSDDAVRALSLGAVDCVDLATLGHRTARRTDLAETVLMAAGSRPRTARAATAPVPPSGAAFAWGGKPVLIGSSTGGVDALMTILSDYPPDGPPTIIAQHMPAPFLESFARRMNQHLAPHVTLAEDGALLEPGRVYLAPGGEHHAALAEGQPPRLRLLRNAEGTADYVPSVDVLFSSAESSASGVIAVMLTGMGRDGAAAMARLRLAGAHTIVQSGESAVIDGMPRAARALDAAVEVVDLGGIGAAILKAASRRQRARA
jgi:two-component system, chemotaxis family, protein-glutamate methylesterase/glutaminase